MKSRRSTPNGTDDRAVSPVIGVILMVAITVILAAVIAAFVLDIGPGEPDPNAAVEVEGDDVELISLDNADAVVLVEIDDGDESIEGALTTTGETTDGVEDVDNIQAVRVDDPDDFDGSSDWEVVTANAIIDNLDD